MTCCVLEKIINQTKSSILSLCSRGENCLFPRSEMYPMSVPKVLNVPYVCSQGRKCTLCLFPRSEMYRMSVPKIWNVPYVCSQGLYCALCLLQRYSVWNGPNVVSQCLLSMIVSQVIWQVFIILLDVLVSVLHKTSNKTVISRRNWLIKRKKDTAVWMWYIS